MGKNGKDGQCLVFGSRRRGVHACIPDVGKDERCWAVGDGREDAHAYVTSTRAGDARQLARSSAVCMRLLTWTSVGDVWHLAVACRVCMTLMMITLLIVQLLTVRAMCVA